MIRQAVASKPRGGCKEHYRPSPQRGVIRDWSGIAVVVAGAVILVAAFSFLALAIPFSTRAPEGPQLASSPVTFQDPNTSYAGHEIWYNFTVTAQQENLTWNEIEFQVVPGPLTRAMTNWSLEVQNATLGVVAGYQLQSGNWTSTSAAPVSDGETIVLQTDSPLLFGFLDAFYPSLGGGSWGVEISST